MKKSKSIVINVPNPCHENWDKMTTTEKGRHCSSCNKTVIDFSAYTDRELVEFISKNTGSVCGRLSPYQVNRPIVSYEQSNSSFLQRIMMGTALVTSMAACNESQNNSQTIPPQTTQLNTDTGKKKSNAALENNYISGRITDDNIGYEDKPISKVIVRVEGTELKAFTDSTGNFRMNVPDSLIGKRITMSFQNTENKGYVPVEKYYTISKLPFIVQVRMDNKYEPPVIVGEIVSNHKPYPPDGGYPPLPLHKYSSFKGDTSEVYANVEEMPKFKGDMNKYITDHIEYPEATIDKEIEGTVYVNFVIEKSGEVSNVNILKGITGGGVLDSAAVKTISGMPKWSPGAQDGKKVRVSMNLPIKFRLNDETTDTAKKSSQK